ncbi:MAG: hypothetical protein KA163_14955 [Bacteroidia bacterium]|nr:hypothetical protein [Bacteroidia bacterium]
MNKIFSLKYFLLNYSVSVMLTVTLILVTLIPFFCYFYMFFILGGLLAHYHLTNLFKFSLTILSFFLNFILWTAEQVNLESTYHDTPFYQSDDYRLLVVLLGTLLWATNKIIIDWTFVLFKAKPKDKMRIELLLKKYFPDIKKTTDLTETQQE